MKKIFISLLCVAATVSMIVSCGETYDEPSGNEFRGTWIHDGIVTGSVDKKALPVFIQIREIGSEKVMLFFTEGRYDSSFVYREESSRKSGAFNLFARRIKDSGYIKYAIIVTGKDGVPLYNSQGTDSIKVDSIYTALKPVTVDSTLKEKYFGTYSFKDGQDSRLHIARYRAIDEKPQIDDATPLREDIYRR